MSARELPPAAARAAALRSEPAAAVGGPSPARREGGGQASRLDALPPPIALLASVRSVGEARLAAAGGADLIDLKEPRAGALGALPLPVLRQIVRALRGGWPQLPVSATIGDLPDRSEAGQHAWLARRVHEVAAAGVDVVKAGIAPGPRAAALLEAFAALPLAAGQTRVPVLLADRGIDMALVAHACALRFPVLMLDTADKRRGTLFDCASLDSLGGFIATVRAHGLRAGLAGSLQIAQAPLLCGLAPDVAGFRGALCAGDRSGGFDRRRLAALRAALGGVLGGTLESARDADCRRAAQRTSTGASSSSRMRGSSSLESSSTG